MRHALFSTTGSGGETCELTGDLAAIQAAVKSTAWRADCLRGRPTFSAITTYLSQLMAHDFVHTAAENTRFEPDLSRNHQAAGNPVNRPDLRRGSLFLNTIYGQGMHIDHWLYGNSPSSASIQSAKFRLLRLHAKNKSLKFYAPAFQIMMRSQKKFDLLMEPIIADRRNMDNAVLLLLSAVFMQFHNQLVDASREETPALEFLDARIKTILTWHRIIRSDVVEKTTMKRNSKSASVTMLRKAGLQAAFRCFHSLALPEYTIREGETETLSRLLSARATSPEFKISPKAPRIHTELTPWANVWAIDWLEFIKNQTCFTPSLSKGFQPENIFSLDIRASVGRGGAGGRATDHLIDCVKDMTSAMKAHFPAGENVGPEFQRYAPLVIQLMAEAYVHGKGTGTLGPNGSQLVGDAIEQELESSRRQLNDMFPSFMENVQEDALPDTFASLFDAVNPNHVKKEN